HPPVLPGADAGQGFPGFPVVAEPAVDGGVVAAPMFVASAALVGGAALDLGLEEIGDGTVVAGAAIGGQQGLDNAAAGAPFSEQGPEVADAGAQGFAIDLVALVVADDDGAIAEGFGDELEGGGSADA